MAAAATATTASTAKAPTVLITGSNRGIGLGLVTQFIKLKYRVIATARNIEKASELQAIAKANAESVQLLQLDTTDTKSCAAVAAALKDTALDVLICNAGVGNRNTLASSTIADFADTYRCNVIGAWQISQSLLPALQKSTHARLIHISSDFASIEITANQPFPASAVPYRCSKAALNQLAAVQSREYNADQPPVAATAASGDAKSTAAAAAGTKPGRITVLAIHPGWVKTDMGSDAAPLEVVTSASAMAKLIDAAPASNSLRFIDYQNKPMPF